MFAACCAIPRLSTCGKNTLASKAAHYEINRDAALPPAKIGREPACSAHPGMRTSLSLSCEQKVTSPLQVTISRRRKTRTIMETSTFLAANLASTLASCIDQVSKAGRVPSFFTWCSPEAGLRRDFYRKTRMIQLVLCLLSRARPS